MFSPLRKVFDAWGSRADLWLKQTFPKSFYTRIVEKNSFLYKIPISPSSIAVISSHASHINPLQDDGGRGQKRTFSVFPHSFYKRRNCPPPPPPPLKKKNLTIGVKFQGHIYCQSQINYQLKPRAPLQAFIPALLSIAVFPQRFSFFTVCLVHYLHGGIVGTTINVLKFRSPVCWKMHFHHSFLPQKPRLYIVCLKWQ